MYNERNKQGTFNICLLQIFFFATGLKNFTNTIYFILGKYGSLFEVPSLIKPHYGKNGLSVSDSFAMGHKKSQA